MYLKTRLLSWQPTGAQASTACAQHVLTPSVVVPCHAHGARAWHPALGGRAVAATRTRDIHVRIAAPDKEDTQGSPEPELPALEQPGPVAGRLLHDWATGYDSLFYEYDYYLEPGMIEGQLPPDLKGTLFHSGPGLTSVFGHTTRHPADADGLVCSLAFGGDGRAFFRNRFVRTPAFRSEQAARRRLHRGLHDRGLLSGSGNNPLTDGWLLNPLDLSFAPRANAGVLHWAGKLYALSDHGLPCELNKQVLDTVGESTMGSVLGDTRVMAPRYKVLPPVSSSEGEGEAGQRLVVMSAAQSGLDVIVRFTELDAAGKVVTRAQHRVPAAVARLLTDFVVTENWYGLLVPPVTFNVQRAMGGYLVGDNSFAECFDFQPGKPSHLHLIPRTADPPPAPVLTRAQQAQAAKGITPTSLRMPPTPPPRSPIILEAPPLVSFSAINGYELDGGRYVVVDLVTQGDLPFWKDFTHINPGARVCSYFSGQPKPEATRFVADTSTTTLTTRTLSHRSAEQACVAPSRVGRLHRTLFAAAAGVEDARGWGPPQVITKLNISPQLGVPGYSQSARHRTSSSAEVWVPGDRSFVGPLTLVPKAGAQNEEDVWVLALIHDAEYLKAELVVLDGSKLTSGPVACVLLPHHIPYGTGTCWTPAWYGPGRLLESDWKPRTPKPKGTSIPPLEGAIMTPPTSFPSNPSSGSGTPALPASN